MRNVTILLAVAAVLALATPAMGVAYYQRYDWTSAGDGDWETATSWSENWCTSAGVIPGTAGPKEPPDAPPPYYWYRDGSASPLDYYYGRVYITNGYTVTITALTKHTSYSAPWTACSPGGKFRITGGSTLVMNAPGASFTGFQSYVGSDGTGGSGGGGGFLELKAGTLLCTGTSGLLGVGGPAGTNRTGTFTMTGGDFQYWSLSAGTSSSTNIGEVHISGGRMLNVVGGGITLGGKGQYGTVGSGLLHVIGSWDYAGAPAVINIVTASNFNVSADTYAPSGVRRADLPTKDSTLWFDFDTWRGTPEVTKIICAGAADAYFARSADNTKGAMLKLGWKAGSTPTLMTDYLVLSCDFIYQDGGGGGLVLSPDTDPWTGPGDVTGAGWTFTLTPGVNDGTPGDGLLKVSYIPEPATMVLLGLGGLGVLLRRRRR